MREQREVLGLHHKHRCGCVCVCVYIDGAHALFVLDDFGMWFSGSSVRLPCIMVNILVLWVANVNVVFWVMVNHFMGS